MYTKTRRNIQQDHGAPSGDEAMAGRASTRSRHRSATCSAAPLDVEVLTQQLLTLMVSPVTPTANTPADEEAKQAMSSAEPTQEGQLSSPSPANELASSANSGMEGQALSDFMPAETVEEAAARLNAGKNTCCGGCDSKELRPVSNQRKKRKTNNRNNFPQATSQQERKTKGKKKRRKPANSRMRFLGWLLLL